MIENNPNDVKVHNVVASAVFNQKINLLDVMKVSKDVDYNPKKFPGVVLHLKKPKTVILIFSTGKMICTGAKTVKQVKTAVNKVVKNLKNNGIIIMNKPKIETQNMVASADLHKMVDLEAASDILDNVMYEPEQFPAIIYRMTDPKVVFLIFNSGKMVVTGAKNEKNAHEATANLREILTEYGLLY